MKHFARPVADGDYAVIFVNTHGNDTSGYREMADRMAELAKQQPGYIGMESVRDGEGLGITVSYWESEESIRAWKANTEHQEAQRRGRAGWYEHFDLRVCRVQRAYGGGAGG